ncbi:MAG: pyruvate ferredoxin oxidoreductase [Gemmatimonadetes bacterium]|jgi:pyruvate-ferredoxin/flavodoxin oxidoreductase|nr:pyruvate ferredoxin oxidoreductase [Gemmatimonadota bacterium]
MAQAIQTSGYEEQPVNVPFPGIPNVGDGGDAAIWVEKAISQAACAYPITSSSILGEKYSSFVANGAKNLWDDTLIFLEPESEHSSASAAEGFAAAGGRVTNFTSGQGLVLMKEVLYTISGKRLPAVFHIGARALTSQSLNVHAGHDDVMAVADVGWGMLFARNTQEVMDLSLISRRAAEDSKTPFMCIQDGFLTTHTVQNVMAIEPEMMKLYVGKAEDKIVNLMDTANPVMSGVVQNQDSYMKGKVAQRYFYDAVPDILGETMIEFEKLTGRHYGLIDCYNTEDADYVIVGMGSMMETAMVAVDHMRKNEGLKVGALHITSFRPFPGVELVAALKHAKAIAVLERMDNPLGQSNPLTMEVKSAFADAAAGTENYPEIESIPTIFSGIAGLGSRDVRAGDFIATVRNMQDGDQGKRLFAIGIDHPLAIEREDDPEERTPGEFAMRGHSIGGYGSVTTNKVIATLLANLGLQVQAYPKYGSEKKGLPTTYYLTAANESIRTHSELERVDFVPLNDVNAFNTGNPLAGVSDGGMIFIQSNQPDSAGVWDHVPGWAKKTIRERNIKPLALNAVRIAREEAPTPDLEQRFQGIVLLGIFLRHTPFQRDLDLSDDELFVKVEEAVRKYWGSKGEDVVESNLKTIRRGYDEVFEVPRDLIESTIDQESDGLPAGAVSVGC